MRKKFLGGMAAAVVMCGAMVSCGDGEKGGANDTMVSAEVTDSVSQAYGTMVGGFVGGELKQYAEDSKKPYDKEAFMAGVQAVMGSYDGKDEYMAGVNTALRMLGDMSQASKMGLNMDVKTVVKNMREELMADSVDVKKAQSAQTVYSTIMEGIQKEAAARQEARQASGPEAVKNAKTAEAFVAKHKELQKTELGTYYTVENPGEGKLKDGDRVMVKYVGSHLDGKVFDQGDALPVTVGQGVVAGFSDGLKVLGKGGKARIYIPGNLGYGAKGVPQAGIGPMEMLVFDIEVVEVNPGAEVQ